MSILTACRWSVAKWQHLKMMMIDNEHLTAWRWSVAVRERGEREGGMSVHLHSAICEMVVRLYSAMSIFFNTRSMVNVCPGYICIPLYVKLIQCRGVPEICAQKRGSMSTMGTCAFCYMWKLFGVVVLQRSMLTWGGYICHGYLYILLYVKLIWCSGVAEIYAGKGGRSATSSANMNPMSRNVKSPFLTTRCHY